MPVLTLNRLETERTAAESRLRAYEAAMRDAMRIGREFERLRIIRLLEASLQADAWATVRAQIEGES